MYTSFALHNQASRHFGYSSYEDTPDATLAYLLDILSTRHPSANEQKTTTHTLPLHLQQLLNQYTFDAVFMSAQARSSLLMDTLAEHNALFFLDPGGEIANLKDEKLIAVLKRADVLSLNLREAQYITKMDTAEDAARMLATWARLAVVKIGAQGAIACQEEKLTYCPAYPIEKVIDTTGAGDAFNGGLIYGCLKGYSLDDILRCGTI